MGKIEELIDQEHSIAATLNRDLLARLIEMDAGVHASSECWSSCRPLLRETFFWVLLSAVVWIGVFVALR